MFYLWFIYDMMYINTNMYCYVVAGELSSLFMHTAYCKLIHYRCGVYIPFSIRVVLLLFLPIVSICVYLYGRPSHHRCIHQSFFGRCRRTLLIWSDRRPPARLAFQPICSTLCTQYRIHTYLYRICGMLNAGKIYWVRFVTNWYRFEDDLPPIRSIFIWHADDFIGICSIHFVCMRQVGLYTINSCFPLFNL